MLLVEEVDQCCDVSFSHDILLGTVNADLFLRLTHVDNFEDRQ